MELNHLLKFDYVENKDGNIAKSRFWSHCCGLSSKTRNEKQRIIISYVQDSALTPPTDYINLSGYRVWYDELGFTLAVKNVNVWNNVAYQCYLSETVAIVPPREQIVFDGSLMRCLDYENKLKLPNVQYQDLESK